MVFNKKVIFIEPGRKRYNATLGKTEMAPDKTSKTYCHAFSLGVEDRQSEFGRADVDGAKVIHRGRPKDRATKFELLGVVYTITRRNYHRNRSTYVGQKTAGRDEMSG